MRIDKYLKLTRLIKRRTVAKELSSRELFKINNKIAKPSSEVKVGDILTLILGHHILTIKVSKILDYVKKDEASSLYEIIKEENVNETEFK